MKNTACNQNAPPMKQLIPLCALLGFAGLSRMNKLHLHPVLLGGALAVFACYNCVAQFVPMSFISASADLVAQVGGQLVPIPQLFHSPEFTYSQPEQSSDGSTASVVLNSTEMGISLTTKYRLVATGKITVSPGIGPVGEVVQTAVSSTSYYSQISANVACQYTFVSTCTSSGSGQASVTFGNVSNPGGPATASGTLAPGAKLTILGQCNGQNESVGPGSATWSFTLELTPINVPKRFTAKQKASFLATSLADLANTKTLLAYGWSTATFGIGSPALAAALATDTAAQVAFDQFLDPPDTNYTVLAQAVASPISPLSAGSGITQLAADAFNAWQTNLSLSAGFSSAWDTSINRAQGAAAASNAYWATAQMSAAVQFETELAAFLDQEPALRSNVVAQFAAAGFTINVTTNDVLNLQSEILTNGLPAQLLDGLVQLGADGDTITNLQLELLTADPGSMAGSFPQSLVNTNLDAAQYATASSLRDAALTLINTAVLPAGQVRFDLPTEPGYTYTIQFNQDLANPAGWTTVLSNSATSTLLSYTNLPTAGRPAGFYRATHN